MWNFRSLETIRSYKLLERKKNGLIQKESRITMVLDLIEKLKDSEIIPSKFWGDRISKGSLYPAAPRKKSGYKLRKRKIWGSRYESEEWT